MTELKLKFKDENGGIKEIPVAGEEFFIGRHSENDLSCADSAVSRRHLKIRRYADVFVVQDLGSTLGTKINGSEMTEPVALKNGDRLLLGDRLEIEIVLEGGPAAADAGQKAEAPDADMPGGAAAASAAGSGGAGAGSGSVSGAGDGSIPMSFFFIAPALGVLILTVFVGIFLVAKSGEKKEVAEANDFIYSSNRLREKNSAENLSETNTGGSSSNSFEPPSNISVNADSDSNAPASNEIVVSNSDAPSNQTLPGNRSELVKIEEHSAAFLRRIAQRDPRAALTGRQQEILKGKIDQFRGSSALAANLRSARASSAQIAALAAEKNLKPQLLAAAAIARLGGSPGNVLTEARAMADVLDDLSRNIGDEFSDDALLVIAAYEQGAAGKTLAMRDMLQSLTDKFPESSRRIRTIWFLKENGRITDSQFEFALRFLAVGTISQNPADFGVNAEAVRF